MLIIMAMILGDSVLPKGCRGQQNVKRVDSKMRHIACLVFSMSTCPSYMGKDGELSCDCRNNYSSSLTMRLSSPMRC